MSQGPRLWLASLALHWLGQDPLTTPGHRGGNQPREARQRPSGYFGFYNHERPHQALDYRTSAQVYFETEEAQPSSYLVAFALENRYARWELIELRQCTEPRVTSAGPLGQSRGSQRFIGR